jgi:hypothetical protein
MSGAGAARVSVHGDSSTVGSTLAHAAGPRREGPPRLNTVRGAGAIG